MRDDDIINTGKIPYDLPFLPAFRSFRFLPMIEPRGLAFGAGFLSSTESARAGAFRGESVERRRFFLGWLSNRSDLTPSSSSCLE